MWTWSRVILFYMQDFNMKMVFWLLQNIQSYRGWQHCWKPCHNTHRLPFKCLSSGENGYKIQLYELFFAECLYSLFDTDYNLHCIFCWVWRYVQFCIYYELSIDIFYVLYLADVLIRAIILYYCILSWLTWSDDIVVYTFSTGEGTVYQLQFNICTVYVQGQY